MQARLFQFFLGVMLSLVGVATLQGKNFQLHGVTVELVDVTAEVDVYYQSMRFNRAAGTWNVEVLLSNKSSQVFSGPLIYYVAGFANTSGPLQPDGLDGAQPFYDLSATVPDGVLDPGELSQPFTLSLGVTSGSPGLTNRIYARGPPAPGAALAVTRTLNEAGQLLPSVSITESGPLGQTTRQSDPIFGVVTLGQTAGAYVWRFSAPDHLPVWRTQSLTTGAVQIVAHPRLTRRSTNLFTLTPLTGGVLGNADNTVQVQFAQGTVVSGTTGTLTPLTGQTLPALLPLGWSPLQAFWLEISPAPLAPATAVFNFASPITPADAVALVRWDEANLQWNTVQVLTGTGNSVTSSVPASGAYALVVGDTIPTAPPAPQPGQVLLAASATLPNSTNLLASGTVNPATSAASRTPELVTANAEVLLTHTAGALPSGVLLHCDVTDSYQLNNRTRRFPPRYDNFIVGYQRPGDTNPATLHARFPLRPLLLFGPDELTEATVHVDVLAPGAFTGSVLEPDGGQVARDGLRILSGLGDFAQPHAAQLRRLSPTNFLELVDTNYTVLDAFELAVDGLEAGRNLRVQLAGAPTNALFVLGRVRMENGLYGIEPRERLISDARGNLTTLEPVTGDRLPGLTSSGQYVLLQARDPQALVAGLARNAGGQAVGGLAIHSFPWLTFSAGNGAYQLLAPTGAVNVTTLDLTSGDTGQANVIVTNAQTTATADLTTVAIGPQVVSVTPTNGATSVLRVTPVIVRFNKPINTATALNGVQLLGVSNQPVVATLTFNLAGTEATLLPINTLAASAAHTILLSTNIADTTGRRLEGDNQFTFTTETDALNRVAAQVVSYEPTNGLVRMTGSVGIAEPLSPVILVNETRGTTATVLSGVDGNFDNFIEADVDDTLNAQVVNRNGSRNVIPVTRQIFRDGSVALFEAGGVVEATGEGRTVEFQIESGSIQGKMRLKMEVLNPSNVLALAEGTLPDIGKLLGPGIVLEGEGSPLRGAVDIAFPVSPAELEAAGLMPGDNPTNAVFALVALTKVDNQVAYLVLDKMEYENGRLVTKSEPFPGAGLFLEDPIKVKTLIEDGHVNLVSIGGGLIVGGVVGTMASGLSGGTFALGAGVGGVLIGHTANQIAMLPLMMAVNALPVKFSGRAIDVALSESGEVVAAKALPGTLVTASPYAPGESAGPVGRLRPGAVYGIAQGDGTYAIHLPRQNEADPPAFTLAASHPRFPASRPRLVLQNQLIPILRNDIIFTRPAATPDPNPPKLLISQQPLLPATNELTRVRVLATHGSELPALSFEVAGASPLDTSNALQPADITATVITNEAAGEFARRTVVEVSCSKPARALLRFTATVTGLDPAVVDYPILFGGTALPGTNPASGDKFDQQPPRVLFTEPLAGSRNWAAGAPIRIQFNEAISSNLRLPEFYNEAITLTPSAGPPTVTLSDDQRELTLTYPFMAPGQSYTLLLTPLITDIATPPNPLDADPATPLHESFELGFRTADRVGGSLTGIQLGGGVVTRGIYAYALERQGPLDGAVVVYDLSNPAAPQKVNELSVPGFPRDLALIPAYPFVRRPQESPRTNDLLVVVGGKNGGTPDPQGQLFGFQYLWVIDITSPLNLQRLASAIVTLDPSAAVSKVSWHPPSVLYLEQAGDLTKVVEVNLQEFIFGMNLTQDEARALGAFSPGHDANADGDYVDFGDGDTLPVPDKRTTTFFGQRFSYLLTDTNQRIQDYDYSFTGGVLSAIVGTGRAVGESGLPDGEPVPGGYRTLFRDGFVLSYSNAVLAMPSTAAPGATAKRVFLQLNSLIGAGAQRRPADLALVSAATSSNGVLVVVDITDPTAPTVLETIPFPLVSGGVQSVRLRDDGRLMVATSADVFLLDPARFGLPVAPGQVHPAIVGLIPEAGSGARSFGGTLAGLYAVNLGQKNLVLQSPPELSFVKFTNAPFDPGTLAVRPAEVVEALLRTAAPAVTVFQARRRTVANYVASSLSPPGALVHTYVLVHAPGSAGTNIQLSLASLNAHGRPLADKGPGFPPVRAVEASTLDKLVGQNAFAPGANPPRAFPAFRLSHNPASPLYNVYLSRPFALVGEGCSVAQLQTLRQELEREILWGGALIRASLDASMENNPVLGSFCDRAPARGKWLPGVHTTALALPADYLMGPNPRAITGNPSVPGTFKTVSAHNGEFNVETTDFALPGRAMPIVFTRVHRAQDLYEGPFGRGWDFNYNQRLVEHRPETFVAGSQVPVVVRKTARDEVATQRDVLFHNGLGRSVVFKFAGATAPAEYATDPLLDELDWEINGRAFYLPPEGMFDILVRFGDRRFGRLTPDGTQYWYGSDGRLEKIHSRYVKRDPRNTIALEYNGDGELTRIVDKSVETPRFLKIGYYRFQGGTAVVPPDVATGVAAKVGKIARIEDYTGRDVLFDYNANGEMTKREGILVTSGHPGAFLNARALTTYMTAPALDQSPFANGLRGLVAGTAQATPLFGANATDQEDVPVVTDGTGAAANGPVTVALQQPNKAEETAKGTARSITGLPDSSTAEHEFTEEGLTKKVTYKGPRAGDATMSYIYDAGLVAGVTYPEGNSVSYLRNLADTLRSRPNILRVSLDPGPRGPGPEGTIPNARWSDYDKKYNFPKGTYTDFNGNHITVDPTSDGLDIGRLDYGTAGTVTMTYNDFGQIETLTTIEGFQFTYDYSPQTGFLEGIRRGGVLFTKLEYSGGGGGFAKAGDLGLARKITPQGEGSAPIEHDYNEREELITIRRANKQEELRSYDQNGHMVRLSRKLSDNQAYVETREVLQNGYVKSITIEGVQTGSAPQSAAAIPLKTTYMPDELFRVAEIQHPDLQTVTKFENYDHLGRYRKMVTGDYAEEYNYDLNGNLTSIKRDTAVDNFFYNGYDRLKTAELAVDGGVEKIEREYFGNGELKRMVFKDTTQSTDREVNFQVDAYGRTTLIEVITDGSPARTAVNYGGGSRVVAVTDPANEITTHTYDAAGRLVRVADSVSTRTFTIDESERLRRVDSLEAGNTFFNKFEPFNDLDQSTEMSDKQGLVARLTPRYDGTPQSSEDALNRRTEFIYSSMSENLNTIPPHGVEFRRSYDALRRLSAEQDTDDKGRSYAFDSTGRPKTRTLRNGAQWQVTDFDSRNNRPKSGTMPGGTFEFSHDAKGRPVSRKLTFGGVERTETMTYDAVDRPKLITFPGGSLNHTYFRLGPYKDITHVYPAGSFTVSQVVRGDGARVTLTYPSPGAVTVATADRDTAGRLRSMTPDIGDVIVKSTDYVAANLVGNQVLGPDVIQCVSTYDHRKRLTRRAFTVMATTNLLAEVRYVYDAVDNIVARQLIHRNGRADFYTYDNGDRLKRADRAARPRLTTTSGRPGYTGFGAPAGVPGNWAAGFFGREYVYRTGGLDLLQSVTEINPDALVPSPFALNYGATDGFLQITDIDGVSRASDALGHATGSRLWTRPASGPAPVPENGTLGYDGFGHLTKVELSSSVIINYGYRHDNLLHSKTVIGPGGTEERTFIYDQGLLLAEYARTGDSNVLHGRYYYADTDVPVAADLRGSDGTLRRFYAMADALGSVMALADAAGNVVERYDYDPWGQPEIELADTNAPRLLSITSTGNGVRLVFSERVLPRLASTSGNDVIGSYDSLETVLTIETNGQPVQGQLELDETASGLPFGVAYRFVGDLRNGQGCQLTINAHRLYDEWGNPVGPLVQAFLYNDTPGAPLFSDSNPADTSAPRVARSAVGWPFLFQGQYFDYDAGLVYMRARFYDPGTGLFLQPDPNGYEDSVNLYAGLGHNPTSLRDPSGRVPARAPAPVVRGPSPEARASARFRGRQAEGHKTTLEEEIAIERTIESLIHKDHRSAGIPLPSYSTGNLVTHTRQPPPRPLPRAGDDLHEAPTQILQKTLTDGEVGVRRFNVGRAGTEFDDTTEVLPTRGSFGSTTEQTGMTAGVVAVNRAISTMGDLRVTQKSEPSILKSRQIIAASGDEEFHHLITADNPGASAARIARNPELNLSSGARAHYGPGVYTYGADKIIKGEVYVSFRVAPGTAVEKLEFVNGQKPFYRLVPPTGDKLKLVGARLHNISESDLLMWSRLIDP